MPNVLVVGATGYIGQALSLSLLRSGNHRAYGLARSEAKAQALVAQEIIPIIGNIDSSDVIATALEKYHIDIVVDVAGANQSSRALLDVVKEVGSARVQTASAAGVKGPKLGFIYCSGIWVHGSPIEQVNDLTPVGVKHAPDSPPAIVAWRPAFEQEVLASQDVLNVIVLRPALVYGRSSTIWTALFTPLLQATTSNPPSVTIPVHANSRPSLIHVDDVASGFSLAVEQLETISGTGVYPVFDLVGAQGQESMRDIFDAAARELGYKGKIELGGAGDNIFFKALSTGGSVSNGRAKTILGWTPKREGLVQNMGVFVGAWKASQGSK